jgi:hypothetical protein
VESQQLCCLTSGQPTTLHAFQEQHTARLAAAQSHLLAVAAQVVAAAKAACEASLAGLEQQLMGGPHAAADAAATARWAMCVLQLHHVRSMLAQPLRARRDMCLYSELPRNWAAAV